MKTKLLQLSLLLLFFTFTLQAQRSEGIGGIVNLERHQFTIGTGFNYELGVLRNLSISTGFSPTLGVLDQGYMFGLAFNTRIRYYHNFKERIDANKKVTGNSANYFGPAASFFWEPLLLTHDLKGDENFSLAFYGGYYGFQRTSKQGLNFSLEAGLGFFHATATKAGFGGIFSFNVGWAVTKQGRNEPEIFIEKPNPLEEN